MKTKSLFFAALLSVCFFTSPSFAYDLADSSPDKEPDKMTKQEFREAYQILKDRIDHLQEAKKEADTRLEKKEIRKEIHDIKKEAKQLKQQASGGIYIGGGALIVIVLLILLL